MPAIASVTFFSNRKCLFQFLVRYTLTGSAPQACVSAPRAEVEAGELRAAWSDGWVLCNAAAQAVPRPGV